MTTSAKTTTTAWQHQRKPRQVKTITPQISSVLPYNSSTTITQTAFPKTIGVSSNYVFLLWSCFFSKDASYLGLLVKRPPSAGFSLPSGVAVPPESILETAAFGDGKRKEEKKIGAKKKKIGTTSVPHSFKDFPQGHEDSEYELSFEIGQWESGFYSERTDRITKSPNHPVPY